jgi:hypothetical protein
MTGPRFSIVIPTRERPHTLEHTLATCLAQEGDFEVVVSDNFSAPATRELVERRADPRVRYVRTPAALAMTDSLEFAAAHARGEFVVMQGDDDGLLRHALPVIDEALRLTGADVLRWESAVYNWPDVRNAHFRPNMLLLPLLAARGGHALHPVAARAAIADAANGRTSYSDLPVIYNSAIRRARFDKLRATTGRVFKTRTPDVHAAFAVAALCDSYHSLRAPVGICGRSGASTGVARHFGKKGSPIDNEFRRMNEAAGLHLHPWVPDLPPIPSAVADAFLWAKADLFPGDATATLDRARLVTNCLREMELDSAAEWDDVKATCRAALADAAELLAWFEREYGGARFDELPRPNRGHHWRRYAEGHLHLDAAAFGARDVNAVADLCERVLGYRAEGAPLKPEAAGATGANLSELQEKEAAIQRLAALHEATRAESARRAARIDQLDAQVRELDARLRAERKWSLKSPVRIAKKLLVKLTRRGASTPTASA